MNSIIWVNCKIYGKDEMIRMVEFVSKNMKGLMPLSGEERSMLVEYAEKNGYMVGQMISVRNQIKIQREIFRSRIFKNRQDKIKQDFIDAVNKGTDIRVFMERSRMSVPMLIKLIKKVPEFKMLRTRDIDYIDKISLVIQRQETNSRIRAQDFENELADFLRVSYKIPFRTENDIRRDGDYTVTPDILFDYDIDLRVDGIDYKVRWLDAKNYILVDVPFILKSLKKQADKYNEIFGMGAFVFGYGYDKSIKIPGTIMLDASFLKS